MLTGSCLCGAVAYEVAAPPGPIVPCRCQSCRKAHGAAFRRLRGAGSLGEHESPPGKFWRFRRDCGSQIFAERPAKDQVLPRLGCLDTAVTDRPVGHIWRSEAAPWYDPADILPEAPEGSLPTA